MTTMGIRELTRHTSKAVHRAAAGETLIITEHDEPVAMLVPLPQTGDEEVDRLVREGRLIPPSNPGGVAAVLAVTPYVSDDEGGTDSADIVSELREDRL